MERVHKIVERFGADIGLELEQKWKANRKPCRKNSNKHLYKDLFGAPERVQPKEITNVYRGGTCSHK